MTSFQIDVHAKAHANQTILSGTALIEKQSAMSDAVLLATAVDITGEHLAIGGDRIEVEVLGHWNENAAATSTTFLATDHHSGNYSVQFLRPHSSFSVSVVINGEKAPVTHHVATTPSLQSRRLETLESEKDQCYKSSWEVSSGINETARQNQQLNASNVRCQTDLQDLMKRKGACDEDVRNKSLALSRLQEDAKQCGDEIKEQRSEVSDLTKFKLSLEADNTKLSTENAQCRTLGKTGGTSGSLVACWKIGADR